MVSAIIVAAGSGRRMGKATPKQYLYLKGSLVIVHTLRALDACPSIEQMILVLPPGDLMLGREEILSSAAFSKEIRLIEGGETRQASVFNGLQAIDEKDGIVVIHDGVRPFVRSDQIETCIAYATRHGACVLGVPVNDTLKRLDSRQIINGTVARESLWQAQTPQVFRYELIKAAHERARLNEFTGSDDALLIERLGGQVGVVCGSRYNIKITTEEDLLLAGAILDARLN